MFMMVVALLFLFSRPVFKFVEFKLKKLCWVSINSYNRLEHVKHEGLFVKNYYFLGSKQDSMIACQKYWWTNALFVNNIFGPLLQPEHGSTMTGCVTQVCAKFNICGHEAMQHAS